jgi:hypothetical protein
MSDLKRAAEQALEIMKQTRSAVDYLTLRADMIDFDDAIAGLENALVEQPKIIHREWCWSWGHQHYMCCYNEVGRLRKLIGKHED